MKTINLYFDFEFTSLSPDAQPISLGIVSDGEDSFYAEFSDFDIDRCDDWVKENVVSKLKHGETEAYVCNHEKIVDDTAFHFGDRNYNIRCSTVHIKNHLNSWLKQFSDYNLQFVCDCGTYDWYWMLQLIGEWEKKPICLGKLSLTDHECVVHTNKKTIGCPNKKYFDGCDLTKIKTFQCQYLHKCKTGLPKLPSNISPVPQDLNDLILLKYLRRVDPEAKVIDAFNASRENILYFICDNKAKTGLYNVIDNVYTLKKGNTHNSLWDAKVIKEIYNKLR